MSICVFASRQWRRLGYSACGRAALPAACLLVATAGLSAAGSQSGVSGKWKQYQDTRNNFSLSIPNGWTVQTDDRRILISSADHGAFAMIENFVPQNDETAEDHVDALPRTEETLLSGCKVTEAYTLDGSVKKQNPNGGAADVGEQAVGILTYTGDKGPGQGRVLCLVFPKGGLLFGLAASNDRFVVERPVMLRILRSFRFNAPAATGGGSVHEAPGSAKVSAPAANTMVDPLSGFNYVPFHDEVEQAFSVEIPSGWTKDGGTFRASVLDSRQTILVRSPHDEMAVMLGDAGLGGFTLPSRTLNFNRKPEGSTISGPNNISSLVMHYMPAGEFNRWYLTNYLGRSIDDLVIGEESDKPEAGRTLTENGNKMLPPGSPAHYVATVSETAFTGRSKLNGRQMAGILFSMTSDFIGNAQGDGNWLARPNIYVWATGDSKASAREAAAKSVFQHMQKTFKIDENWSAAENTRQKNYVAMFTKATQDSIRATRNAQAQSAVMSRQTAQSSDDRRQKMMGDFKARMAAKDDNTRKMQNYSLDQTDVTNGSQSWKVASGYTNYYRHEATGTIVGTNDPTNPGVGFTQLGQR